MTTDRIRDALAELAADGLLLTHWTIYAHPAEYPDGYVLRKWYIGTGLGVGPIPARAWCLPDLEAAQDLLPPGLHCVPRSPNDDPSIVETWL
jgi:hypothetical protein